MNIAIYIYIYTYMWRALSSTFVAKSQQPWQTRALKAAVNTAKNCPTVALQRGKVEHYYVVVGAVVLLVWCGCQNSKERAKNIKPWLAIVGSTWSSPSMKDHSSALPSFLPSFLPSCCLPACLPAFLPCCLPSGLPAFLPFFLPACLPACVPAFQPSFLPSSLPSFPLCWTFLIARIIFFLIAKSISFWLHFFLIWIPIQGVPLGNRKLPHM